MNRLNVVILLLIVLAACQSNKLVELNLEQVHRETLKSDSLGMSGKMKAPRKVFVVGDYLALLEDKDKQGFLHFYDMDGKFVSKYGIIGRAAQEFFIPNVFPDADSLIVLSMDGKYTDIYCEGSEIKMTPIKRIGNKNLNMGLNFIAKTLKGDLVVDSELSTDMLTVISGNEKTVGYNIYPFDTKGDIDSYLKKNVIFSCSYALAHSPNACFVAFKNYPVFGFQPLNGGKPVFKGLSVDKKNEYEVHKGTPYYSNPILFYTYAVSSDSHCYALYQNAEKKEMAKGVSEIHVFDFTGNMIRRYILDQRIYHFAVRKDDSAIYALGLNEQHLSELYVFDL